MHLYVCMSHFLNICFCIFEYMYTSVYTCTSIYISYITHCSISFLILALQHHIFFSCGNGGGGLVMGHTHAQVMSHRETRVNYAPCQNCGKKVRRLVMSMHRPLRILSHTMNFSRCEYMYQYMCTFSSTLHIFAHM